jgi:Skp family chaperone for outer membrane proteins
MKRISLIAVGFIFAAIFSVSAFGQAAATGKVGLVDMYRFAADDKPTSGITKYKNALKALNKEFEPAVAKLNTKITRYQALGKEIQDANKANPAVPVAPANLQAKVDELQNLEIQIKREQEDLKVQQGKRQQAIVGPIMNDILEALNDYAKKNGYAVILDGSKLVEQNILLGFDEKYDVTDDFVKFYNARPASAATASTPK